MLSFYLIFTLIYAILLLHLGGYWPKARSKELALACTPSVTLLIPFRNEIEFLPKLLPKLANLKYPNFQILLIDDHSEDGSIEYLEKHLKHYPKVQLIESGGFGKKAAIEYGITQASGEIIITSDADCTFEEAWITSMVAPFLDTKIQFVAGPVLLENERSFVSKFQLIDWASILLVTNYFFKWQRPLMCSAANMAYRKTVFQRINGYEGNRHYSSGDDEFLLKKIMKEYGGESCVYIINTNSLVLTKAERSWSALFNQRIRWASKWSAHSSFYHICSATGAFMIALIWLLIYGMLAFGGKGVLVLMICLSVKYVIEYLVLGKILKSFNREYSFLSFICASFIYSFYVMRVTWGALQGNFTWKGRVNSGNVNLEIE